MPCSPHKLSKVCSESRGDLALAVPTLDIFVLLKENDDKPLGALSPLAAQMQKSSSNQMQWNRGEMRFFGRMNTLVFPAAGNNVTRMMKDEFFSVTERKGT